MAGRGLPQGPVAVVIGVDGAGRSHRLEQLGAASDLAAVRIGPGAAVEDVEKLADDCLVLVDDPHRLTPDVLAELTRCARAGHPMAMARRPSIPGDGSVGSGLAELDEALAPGGVEVLAPLDVAEVGELLAAATGRSCSEAEAQHARTASAGMPAIVHAMAREGSLAARLQRTLATAAAPHSMLALVLAQQLTLDDRVLARACVLDLDELDDARTTLRDAGLLRPGTEELIPAVADALLSELPAGRRRRIHAAIASALLATGAPAVTAAEQLRAARAGGPDTATAYARAGEQLRFSDPQAALGWFDDAREAGAPQSQLAAGRAEVSALLGIPIEPGDGDGDRVALATGAAAGHDGRADRAIEALLGAAAPGPALAVPSLIATGRLDLARNTHRDTHRTGPAVVRLLARAALAAADPQEALPRAIEAAEALERGRPDVVLPDTPHALGAVLAVATGDSATALDLLERGLASGAGGPVARSRHRLLLAWTMLRRGQPEAAREQLAGIGQTGLGGRDHATLVCIRAGLARRAGDVASLRQVWPDVERLLARRSLDLFTLEAAEELAVAAARLRRVPKLAAALGDLDAIVRGLGDPAAWVVALGWLRLQVAVGASDVPAAREAADRMAAAATTLPRDRARQSAARLWADALAGDVRPDQVGAAAADLADAEMPYEASRLAGDAGIRVTEPAAARRLLELARELTAPVPVAAAGAGAGDPAQLAGLSEREVAVAELVLAGRTHREIGAQLYIAPKTVEHHVARIRTKLGATSRAEFFAVLNTLFEPDGAAAGRPAP